jgi:outer membrane protein assembly factor BamD
LLNNKRKAINTLLLVPLVMKKIFLFNIIIFLLLTASCSKFQRIVKDPKWQNRYNAALAYYEKGDYYRAGALLEDLVPILVGTLEAEKARFYVAYCYFKQGQYTMSHDSFKNFHSTYSRSEFAEEALFMSAYSQYMDSPASNLDQSHTNIAIDAFQDFINRYPNSKYAQQASGEILELRAKLEQKYFNTAILYQKLVNYKYEYSKSAVIAYENFRKDFPDSKLQEEVAFHKIQAQYDLAKNSYYTKQRERFEELIGMFVAFSEKYPKSKFLKQAENIAEQAQKQISNLRGNEQKNNTTAQNVGTN